MFRNRTFHSVFCILISLFYSYAQVEKQAIPLKEVLSEISKQHDVKFNYIEDEIILFALISPKKELNLEQKLNYLSNETKLTFHKISSKYYTISNDKKLDKPLCGFLINDETKIGIENALIIIENTNTSTFSDANGYFELPKISSNTIKIEHQGFENFEINPEDLYVVNCPNFYLKPIIQTLEEVKTGLYLTTGIYKRNDGSIIIKPQNFGILPGLTEPDVLQTMQQIPGILSIDETISNISVRGGTHDQNLFLWNDIRMFQTGHFFGLISAFNPTLSHTISITKNGSSAFFGESVSSLVILSSRNENDEKPSTTIGSNMISAEFYKKLKLSKTTSITISGRRSFTDFFYSPAFKNYSKRIFQNTEITDLSTNQIIDYNNNVDFYFYDASIQLQQKIGKKNELNLDLITIKNHLDFEEYSATDSSRSELKQTNFGGSLSWKTNWNKKNSTQIISSFSNYNLISENQTLESNQTLNQENKVLDLALKLQHNYEVSNKFKLGFGYQINEIGVTNFDEINLPIFSRKITNVLISHAGITESTFQSNNKKSILKLGVRGNYFEKFNVVLIEPRLQFNQKISSNFNLEILGEFKNQTLSQIIDLQQDFLGIEKRRWTLANNESIPIQKSKQVSIGFTFKKNNWLINLDNFYKEIDGITTSSQGFQNQFEFIKSTGSYAVFGSELLIQKNFGNFYTWINYTFNENNYSFEALTNGDFQNNFEIMHTINWSAIYEWNNLKIALGSKYHTGRPITTPLNLVVTEANPNIIYDLPNRSKLDDYFQMNFSVSRKWNFNDDFNLQTAFSIINVLNTKNSINRFYRVNSSNNSIESVDTYSMQFTPNFSFKLSF
ncbi:TonB-dependent receptor [Flavobacterium capsici]|uniref:TonB-dependent receptor plug domain-containing protein n=1 Tax=Flavobacterium capsici TaxID=3075618 RepID=A0AA96F7E9_9FLAO|nr:MULTISPECIES: TonB-dependent receptor plug domain-containing protein [unclassified Flavobacterium]WNM18965.1 TonB-dependent receptor plug domain-containing protein [Flavobacterium sp. PMR2A8]WNM23015.1 TonB-dependent receptor plug domain-containing protein [Flavobacterium sp. PMTSA4]